ARQASPAHGILAQRIAAERQGETVGFLLAPLNLVQVRVLPRKQAEHNGVVARLERLWKVLPELLHRNGDAISSPLECDDRRRSLARRRFRRRVQAIATEARRDDTVAISVGRTAPLFAAARVLIELERL